MGEPVTIYAQWGFPYRQHVKRLSRTPSGVVYHCYAKVTVTGKELSRWERMCDGSRVERLSPETFGWVLEPPSTEVLEWILWHNESTFCKACKQVVWAAKSRIGRTFEAEAVRRKDAKRNTRRSFRKA